LENKLRTEYDACRSLCSQYQAEALQFAERCRTLEDAHTQLTSESNQIRSQLAVTSQLSKDQATQLVDLERRLMQTSEALKTAGVRQIQLETQLRDSRLSTEKHQTSLQSQLDGYSKQCVQLEGQLRDSRLTAEKHHISVQAQVDAYVKQCTQQDNQLKALETANGLLKEELSSLQADNNCLSLIVKKERELSKELTRELDNLQVQKLQENDEAQTEVEALRLELAEIKLNHHTHSSLKMTLNEVEKRCVKHQKAEIEAKRQLNGYQQFVGELQFEIQDLTERLAAGADEYKALFRKHAAVEQRLIEIVGRGKNATTTLSSETGLNEEALVTLLRNSYELQKQDQQKIEEDETEEEEEEEEKKNVPTITAPVIANREISECPMCYWEFPKHLTLDEKKEHIDHHFS